MMTPLRGIAFNTSLYTVVLTVQKLLSFIFFSYLARSLGAASTGNYFFAMSLAAILATLIDTGLTPVLTRDIARDSSAMQRYVASAFFVKIVVTVIVSLLLLFIVPLLATNPFERSLIYCAFALAFIDSISLSVYGAIRARHTLVYESIGAIVFQLFILIVGSLAVFFRADIRLILGVVIAATVLHAAIGIVVLRRVYAIRITKGVDLRFAKKFFVAAIPFFLAAAFVKVNAYSDSLLLKLFLDDETLGIYSVAYKITFAFQFIPLALMAALYPAFSHQYTHAPSKVQDFFLVSSKYLLIVIVPVVLGLIAVASEAIPFVYTETYRASVVPLVILLLSLPMVFLSFPIGSLLNAINAQTLQTVNQGIAMVVAIVVNMLLIPHYGAVGAAAASFLATAALFIAGIIALIRRTQVSLGQFFNVAARISIAAFLMYVAVLFLKTFMPWYMTIVPGGIVYALLLFAVGSLSWRDLARVRYGTGVL